MRLQNQGNALNRRGIGALPALDEPLFDQALGLGKQSDALARVAFAARVVGETLAVCRLREKARQGELADAVRAREQQSVGDAVRAQCSAKGGHDLWVTAKLGEGHGQCPRPKAGRAHKTAARRSRAISSGARRASVEASTQSMVFQFGERARWS